MKKATKWAGIIIASAVCVTSVAMLAACSNDDPKPKEYTVTYYDGTTVLEKQKVKEGEKATKWTPEKPDYTFVDWYATPNFAHLFPFDEPVNEDKSAFAQWTSATQSEDTRTYYIVGSGTSPILMASNWGKGTSDKHKMTKTEGKNEYTYTVDLYEGDKFQFEITGTGDWQNQRGAGYLTETKLSDGTEVFSGAQTIGDNSAYRLDVKCEYSGNYTFTLTTHPDDDTYESNHPSYSEANKEAFNINPLDTISWVRNGDAPEITEKITDYFIKGSGITNWKNMVNASTKMTNNNGVYSLEVYLKANEEFMFASQFTVGTDVSEGNVYIRASNLDEASKAYVGQNASYNMLAKASGTYTFTYTKATQVLSVAFNADKTPAAADYYIDGTFAEGVADWSGYCFNNDFKLTETKADSGVYEIKNVALKADSQIIIQAFKAGSTERGEWGTDGYNGLGSYNFTYLYGGGTGFAAVGGGNNNIKVVTAGSYDITFDSYAKIITIESVNAVNDAYIVGTMTGAEGWKVLADWKMTLDAATNTYTITATFAKDDAFGVRVMNGATTEQKFWFASSAVSGTPAGFKLSDSNITCTDAGTYTITCTVTDTTGVITIAAAG